MRAIRHFGGFPPILSVTTAGVGLAACEDHPQAPIAAPPLSARQVIGGQALGTADRVLYVRNRKNGRETLQRVRIDRTRMRLIIETLPEYAALTDSIRLICDDPTAEGCSTEEGPGTGGGFASGELSVSGEDSVRNETGEPWDPSYAFAGEDGGPYHCPAFQANIHFSWKGHRFETEGVSQFIERLPSTIGVPKGRYRLPQGPWLSDDGKARIWSGTVDATCYVRWEQYLLWRIEIGVLAVYRFNGEYDDFTGPTFASYGTSYQDDWETTLWQNDPEAYAVIMRYFETQQCTPGWVIVVDGEREC